MDLLNRGPRVDVEQFFVIAWASWKRRNQFVFEEKLVQSNVILDFAFSLQSDYQALSKTSPATTLTKKGWSKPAKDSVKLNVDGALFPDRMMAGVDSVLQDEQGKVLIVATKSEHIWLVTL